MLALPPVPAVCKTGALPAKKQNNRHQAVFLCLQQSNKDPADSKEPPGGGIEQAQAHAQDWRWGLLLLVWQQTGLDHLQM
ncbi:MAG TPA: hypothetical protein PLB24_06625, partial [Comamonas denitrificans]|nr:hypothetical protein [Comamonas denitrificans]